MSAGSRRYAPNAGWPLARTGTRSNLRPAPNWRAQYRATRSRPSYPNGSGGIAMKTSSVSRATSALRSADSHARANLATIASSAGEPAAGGGWWLEAGAGSFERTVGRFEGHLQHAGYLAGVESKDVAQDEDGDLAWWQQLQGGHEGQRDGFGLL